MEPLIERAVQDARMLAKGGCGALLIENFGDLPFFAGPVPPETASAMALAVAEVRREVGALPVGVNVLRNDARTALALCATTGAAFFRVNVHTGVMVTDQGLLEGRAAETLRERAHLAPRALILADVHVKHGSPLGSQPIGEAARDALERGLADAVIVSGRGTGDPPARADLALVREAIGDRFLLVGSDSTRNNAAELLSIADGAIVGTFLKRDSRVDQPVEPTACAASGVRSRVKRRPRRSSGAACGAVHARRARDRRTGAAGSARCPRACPSAPRGRARPRDSPRSRASPRSSTCAGCRLPDNGRARADSPRRGR
jgi:membrane complex biogenesis BtpA family protein